MSGLTRVFSFRGRATRWQWWLSFMLVFALVNLLPEDRGDIPSPKQAIETAIIFASTLVIWVFAAASARRWHDMGKSGWCVLYLFFPFFGLLILLICCGCLPGQPGANAYGSPSNLPRENAD